MPVRLGENRDFRRLWIGEALSLFGSRISNVAYPLLALALTHSPAKAGLVGAAGWLPFVVLQLPAGAAVDRWNRKRVMVACDLGRAVALASIAATAASGVLTYPQLLAVAFIEYGLLAFFSPAETAAISRIVPPEQLSDAVARNESREYTAFLGGPAVGGALLSLGRGIPFLADAVSYAASLVAVAGIRTRLDPEPVAARARLREEIADGLRWVRNVPFLRATLLLAAGGNFASNSLMLVLIVLARDRGASTAATGAMVSIVGAGGLAGSLAAPWLVRRLPARTVVIGLDAVRAPLIIPLAFVANAYLLGIIGALTIFLAPAWNSLIVGRRIALVPNHLQARVHSVDALISYSTIPLAYLAAGFLLSGTGPRPTVFFYAGWVALLAFAAAFAPGVRQIPTAAAAQSR
jgi:predicted MFS family arabinose efflux permease